jgi:hypothetical protein
MAAMPPAIGHDAPRAYLRIPVAALPLCVPVLLMLVWHLQDHRWPNDDAANFATTAVQIADRFHTGGLLPGLQALIDVRGWRPIVFPTLLVPYLLAFHGNVPLAVGGLLWTLYAVLTVYAYRLSRLFLPPVRAAIAAWVVSTSPIIAQFTTIFFSELSWVCFALAWAYHLLASRDFRRAGHSALAGVFLGLMVATRPAESVAMAGIPIAYFLIRALRRRTIGWTDVLLASALAVVSGGLLVASLYGARVSRAGIWLASGLAAAGCLIVVLRRRPALSVAHVSFWTYFWIVSVVWWAGFVSQLYDWAYATSFGHMAKVTAPPRHAHVLTALAELIDDYGTLQFWGLIGLASAALLMSAGFWRAAAAAPASMGERDGEWPSTPLVIVALGSLLPILLLYWLSSTGDPRRAMVGMTLLVLMLSIVAMRSVGPLAKYVVGLVCVVPLLQTWQLLPACLDLPLSQRTLHACCGQGPGLPLRSQDGNEVMADALTHAVPKGSRVAVYTLALFSTSDRIYEPAGLALCLAARHAAVTVGYSWDEGAYAAVVERLGKDGYEFVLLDTWDSLDVRQSHMPYVHFASALLDSLPRGDEARPGLVRLESFTVLGRTQVLFGITVGAAAQAATPEAMWAGENIAAAWRGARAVTTSDQSAFDAASLNDDSPAAWGSAEGLDDTYAGVLLPEPQAVHFMRLVLFATSGGLHLRDVSVAVSDVEAPAGPQWRLVRARIQEQKAFAEKFTVPPLSDGVAIVIEIDPRDPNAGPHRLWGIACLSGSRGYTRNYLKAGTGVYLRELQLRVGAVRK